jgi:hypothetical protein
MKRPLSNLLALPSCQRNLIMLWTPLTRRDHQLWIAIERFLDLKSQPVRCRRPSDAHHLRFMEPRALGRRVGDEFAVPLCRTPHRSLHRAGGEPAWWAERNLDAVALAGRLWERSRLINGALIHSVALRFIRAPGRRLRREQDPQVNAFHRFPQSEVTSGQIFLAFRGREPPNLRSMLADLLNAPR